MRSYRATLLAVSLLVMGSTVATNTIAAPATPTAAPIAHCDAPPRSQTEIAALLANPDLATPAAATAGATLPNGTPVTAADSAAMKQVINDWLACQNAGEQLRAWTLFSDGYLARLLSRQGGLSSEAYERLATPSPTTSAAAAIQSIRGQRVLPDGRLGATVTIAYAAVPMPKTFFFYFTRQENGLLIDSILGEISFSLP